MVRVNKLNLALIAICIDKNNPKFELDYLYVDSENMVATDSRALVKVKHYDDEIKEPFYVHGAVIRQALKVQGAVEFILNPKTIHCLDKDSRTILSISREHLGGFKFPEYKNVIPKNYGTRIAFAEPSQVSGIFAVNHVWIDDKYIPKKLDSEFRGFIGINESNLPVSLFNDSEDITIVVMPIVDNHFDFKEE